MGTEFGAFLVEEDSLYQGPGLSINQSYCRGTIFVQDEKRKLTFWEEGHTLSKYGPQKSTF